VRELGFDLVQEFLFAKPVAAEQFRADMLDCCAELSSVNTLAL
jgi:hypothetical protein